MKYFRYIVTIRLKKGEKRGAYTTTTYKTNSLVGTNVCRSDQSASSPHPRPMPVTRQSASAKSRGSHTATHGRSRMSVSTKRKWFPSIRPRSPQVKITSKAKGRSSDSSPVPTGLPDSKISDRKSVERPRRAR